jgi:hypothetical protein
MFSSQLSVIVSTSDIKLDNVSDLSALCTSGLITRDIVSSLGLSITVLNTSGILSDIVLSEHAIINSDKLSESSARVKSGVLLGNVELSSINPKKGETSFCDSNTSNNAQQSSAGGVIEICFRGAKSRPAINPSEDNSNSTKFGGVLHGPRHYCSVGSGDSSILCFGVDGAESKSCVTDVTGCSIKIGSENTKNGRVLCGTCHSHQQLAEVECPESKLLAEVMAEQCTEAKLAEPSQASAVGSSSSNEVVGWNIPAVLSSRDVCLNLYYDLDTGQVKSSIYAGASHAQVQLLNMAEWLNVLNILTSNLMELAEHGKSR